MNARRFYPADTVLALLIIGPAILVWEIGVRIARLPIYILPAPTAILKTLLENLPLYTQASLITLGEAWPVWCSAYRPGWSWPPCSVCGLAWSEG